MHGRDVLGEFQAREARISVKVCGESNAEDLGGDGLVGFGFAEWHGQCAD